MPTNTIDATSVARTSHDALTQMMLAASDASHPLRGEHRAEALLRDARQGFQNMGQTLVPELLRELDAANKLLAQRPQVPAPQLSQQDMADFREIRALAREHGWSMSVNKRLPAFMRDLVDGLTELTTRPKGVAEHALSQLKEWWSGNDMRYAEVSAGRKHEVMVTLWQVDVKSTKDVKVGHGEGDTLEVAVQRARGTIVL